MDVISVSPMRAASMAWQPGVGTWLLTVVCKATYCLLPVTSELAPEQEDPNEDENHWNDDAARSVYSPSDLCPFKPKAEVMLVGAAFAPRGKPAGSVIVRLIVGEIDKSIEVFGERSFSLDGALHDTAKFTRAPLLYERAAGGPETDNPVGVRADVRDMRGVLSLPNLQPPGLLITSPDDHIAPIGFGPIAASWPSRQRKLGTLAGAWSERQLAEARLPDGIDLGYFMAAPPDQHLEALRPNERIILENLHAQHERLVTSLPGLAPRAFVERPGAAPHEAPMTADTLWIDTNRALCTLTWRALISIDHPRQAGRVVVGMSELGQPYGWADVEALLARASAPAARREEPSRSDDGDGDVTATTTATAPPGVMGRALPFVARSGDASSMPQVAPDRVDGRLQPTAGAAPGQAGPSPRPRFGDATLDVPRAMIPPAAPTWLQPARRPPPAPPPPAPAKPAPAPPPPVTPEPHPPAPPYPAARSVPVQPIPVQSTPAPPPVPPPPVQPPPVQPLPVQPRPQVAVSPWAGGTFERPAPLAAQPPQPMKVEPPPAATGLSSAAPSPSARSSWSSSKKPAETPQKGVVAASNAAALGVVAASNAAALTETPAAAAATPAAPVAPAAPAAAAEPVRDAIELLWFDPAAVARIRAARPFRESLGRKETSWLAVADAPKEGLELQDRRDMLRILVRAPLLDVAGVARALDEAVDDEGSFNPPLAVLTGELVLRFDPRETLRATLAVVAPLVGNDKKLAEAVAAATEALRSALQLPDDVAEILTRRMEEAFAQAPRTVAPGYLRSTVDKLLLEGRHYLKKTLLGEPRIRAELTDGASGPVVPAYLPASLTSILPLFVRLRVRVIAELRYQEDQHETSPEALVVMALGRALRRRREGEAAPD